MSKEFIKKGNKYYRNNSDGTQTEVTPTQEGYFTWTQPDGKKVRSQKRYKISTTSQQKEKSSLWDSFKTGLINFGVYSATSEPGGSAIQTSEGTQINNDGSFTYNKPTEGSEQLRKINGVIGLSGLAGYGGGAALSYTPAIVPEITIGQLPWQQTAVGTAAGSMATGMAADEASIAATGKNISDHFRSAISQLGTPGKMYADIIPEPIWDFTNPFNPQQIGQLVKSGVRSIANRFTSDGWFTLGNKQYRPSMSSVSIEVPKVESRSVWQLKPLPGYQIKSLMTNGPLERYLSKNGTLSLRQLQTYIRRNDVSTIDKKLLNRVLQNHTNDTHIDYNVLRQEVQDMIPKYTRVPPNRIRRLRDKKSWI